MISKIKSNITYTRIIAFSFFAVILAGTLLLYLPISAKDGDFTPIIDCLFTATSATCVTGLVVYDTYNHWSLFGQIVILLLIQIGGLGLMTVITMFSIFMKKHFSLHERRLLMESASTMRISGIVTMVKHIVIGTLSVELFGAAVLTTCFYKDMGLPMAIWYGVFHSISAFCNAGFDIMGQFNTPSLTAYVGDPVVTITIMLLIITGGLGFLVWGNILFSKFRLHKMELHSKIVILTTIFLIVSGGILLYFTDCYHAFSGLTPSEKWLAAFFQSVTTRTAGFNSVDQAALSNAGSIISIILMFIGGSPGSTAGGIKTTTFAIIIMNIFSSTSNSPDIILFKRKVNHQTVNQAYAIGSIYLLMVLFSTILICAIEPFGIKETAFEVVSAIGTVGLSMGITSVLSAASKLILIFLMYSGRIGGLSLVLTLAEKKDKIHLDRPTEKIVIG